MTYDQNHYPPTSDNRKIVVWVNIFDNHDTEALRALYEQLRTELHAVVYKPEYEAIHARVVQG